MKKYIVTLMMLPVILCAKGQIDPAVSSVVCPSTPITFHYSLSGDHSSVSQVDVAGIAISGVANSLPVQVTFGSVTTTYGPGLVLITFTGSFQDKATPQGIRISWWNSLGVESTVTLRYDQIASYNSTGGTIALAQPSPLNISPTLTQVQSFNITVPTLKYVNDFVSPILRYGSITSFEYLLPAGWKLGSIVSDGVTWLAGSGNVTVTSDPCTGGDIKVRGTRCTTGLTAAPAAIVTISRPAPAFSVGATASGAFCTGDNRVFSVNDLPAGATVAWSASPAGIVTINSPNATQTALTRTGSGLVTLTATITACGNTYTATSSVIPVGSPAPTNIIKGPGTNYDVEVHIGQGVPGATSYNWTMNGTAKSQHGPTCEMSPVSCRQTFLACVAAVNACGTSPYFCKSITNTPCSGGGAFVVSPNPASSTVSVSIATSTASKTDAASNVSSFDEIRLYDQQGTLKQRQVYQHAGRASIDVSKQPAGTYFVEIINGTYVERQMVIIRR